MSLVCRESGEYSRGEVVGAISESKKVQILQRPSILCNSRMVFFFWIWCQEPFCLQSISNKAGEALFV